MKKVIVYLLIVLLLFSASCSVAPAPAPAPMPRPTPTPVPMPTPMLTNSESDSRVGELEAKIRQLEAENQRLTGELAIAIATLQNIRSIVNSSSYINTFNSLNDIRGKAGELALFAGGLPELPPLPPGLTVREINEAINKASTVRRLIRDLPPLPPPGWPFFIPFPPELHELERQRQIFLEVTEFMENLRDLPEFLATAGSLKDLRSRIEGYLGDVQNTASDAGGILKQVRDIAGP